MRTCSFHLQIIILIFIMRHIIIFLLSALVCHSVRSQQTPNSHYWLNNIEIQQFSTPSSFPHDGVNTIHQSADGFLWFGTVEGLFRYDGYRFVSYRNDIQTPSVLTSNNVLSILSTQDNKLWVGTNNGINIIDRLTGITRQYHLKDFDNSDIVGCLLATRNGNVWVGTEGGLYLYNKEDDVFMLMCDQRGNSRVPHSAIKAIYEDQNGFLWIGTWNQGLFRYDVKNDNWYSMPKFNDINSAHCVFMDENNTLWVGTWGKGIYRIDNPYDTNKPLQFQNFMIHSTDDKELSSNYIYSITKSPDTNRLWIATSQGICFCDYNQQSQTFYLLPEGKEPFPQFFGRGVDNLIFDRHGNIFMTSHRMGVAYTLVSPHNLYGHSVIQDRQLNEMVRGMTFDSDNNLWMALEDGGVRCIDTDGHTDKTERFLPHSILNSIPNKINTVFRNKQGVIFIGTGEDGIIVYDSTKGGMQTLDKNNTEWLTDNCVYTFAEDKEGNIYVGGWHGLSVIYNNGKGISLDMIDSLADARVQRITIASDGTIWLATRNTGFIHITGNIHNPQSLKVRHYVSPQGSGYRVNDAVSIVEDNRQRIWACSHNIGLMLYDNYIDAFVCMNKRFNIPTESLYALEASEEGTLWMSTHQSLLSLTVNDDNSIDNLNYYTIAGLAHFRGFSNYLSARSIDGRMAFAGASAFTTFHPDSLPRAIGTDKVSITNIRIAGKNVSDFPLDEREDILSLLPPFTEKMVLQSNQNNFALEFSTFNFASTPYTAFAYMLEGYDKEWMYAEQGINTVNYSNLPSGTYTFRLRGADPQSLWSQKDKVLTIVVLPPLWLRWWALLLYALVAVGIIYGIVRYYRSRLIQRQQLQIAQMEAEKVEELNHKKLQFYTNITHDLMTPLTIISASMDTMKGDGKQVIQNNVNRLMRLLEQILQFRKAETGNLRLMVSKGDIADFCRREIESIQPLMQKKQLHLSIVTSPDTVRGYFDPDALDKILYNLLSNAAKYNRPMGYVQVSMVRTDEKPNQVVITVKDNGMGIKKEKQATLFDRFYEGEHRKFNTYGTGIGLSLTRDLVHLHHGEISFESQEGVGTTFTITLPIDRASFAEEEIDEQYTVVPSEKNKTEKTIDEDEVDRSETNTSSKVLIVEDNDDILAILRHLLSSKYQVLTAYNGKEALEILENEAVDLVVTDIMMPVMDGLELLRHIRENDDNAHLPIIMLTAKRDDQDRAESYSAGADAYITKPFNSNVLMSRVENLMERSQATKKELKKKDLVGMTDIDLTSSDEEFLKRCIACVQKNIGNFDFDQQQFAEQTGTSKSTLYKKLKALTGMNTSAFIRSIRMKTAREVLEKNPTIRISDLAYSVGYNDPKYFSSCFKKDFGMLPTEYVKN